MKKSVLFSILAVLFLLSATTAMAANLCVGGTPPCYTTVQAAVNATNPGDIVTVKPGVYYENVVISTNNITVAGGGITPDVTVIDGHPKGSPCAGGYGIDIEASNVTVRNLTVRNSCSYNIYVDEDNVTIDKVNAISGDSEGIDIVANNAIIKNSNVSGNNSYSIYIDGDNALIQNNKVYSNYDEVYVDGAAPKIIGNDIHGVNDSYCLYVEYADGALIQNNKIANCYDYGLYVYSANGATITGNSIRSVDDTCMYLDDFDNSTVSNNSVEACDGSGIEAYPSGGAGGNNVFLSNVVRSAQSYGMEIEDNNPTITGNKVTNTFDEYSYDIYCYDTCTGGTISANLAADSTADEECFELTVSNMTISNNTASFCSEVSFDISGDNNIIKGNVAMNSATYRCPGCWDGSGFYVSGSNNTITTNKSLYSIGTGFELRTSGTFSGNTAANNFGSGVIIDSGSGALTVDHNITKGNQRMGIANEDGSGSVNIQFNTSQGNRTDICNDGTATFTGNIFISGGATTTCDLL